MATTTFYRKASNVSSAEATASLFKRFPNAELVSFETRTAANADEAQQAGAKEDDLLYVATIRTAEFPPAGDGGEESEAPSEDAPADDAPSDDAPSDDAPAEKPEGDDDKGGDKPFGGGDEGGEEGGKPKELKGEELTNHLLKQILDAVAGGGIGGPPGPDAAGPGGPGDLDLPDIGAPEKGEAFPPPGGPGAAGPGKPPLPSPVKEKSPIGVGAFAHVAGKSEIHMVRADAGSVNNKTILDEAAEHAPTHNVARIQRSGSAVINGETINVAERGIAVVTLVRK